MFLSTYWVFTGKSGSLIFAPLWAPHKVLEDNLKWYGYAEKYYTYTKYSVVRGIVEIEVFALTVFIIGSLGTRIVGFLMLLILFAKKHVLPSPFALVIALLSLESLIIPLFFIQSIKVFDIIQVAWYFLFFSSLAASFGFVKIFVFRFPKVLKILLFVILVVLTLPSAYEKKESYVTFQGYVPKEYYDALVYLRHQGSYTDTILQMPSENMDPTEKSLVGWYYTSSPTVAALANKRAYLLQDYYGFPGIDTRPRIRFLRKVILFDKLPSKDLLYGKLKDEVEEGFRQNNITYIFSAYPLSSLKSIKGIRQVFRNEQAIIYKINKN